MLACGIVWSKTADPDAGWELVKALASPDPELRQFTRDMLMHRRDNAMHSLRALLAQAFSLPKWRDPASSNCFERVGPVFPIFWWQATRERYRGELW